MPNKRASFKSVRAGAKKRDRNTNWKSELKTRARKIAALVQENRPDEVQKLAREIMSRYDKAANKKVIRKKTAARKKSRLAKRIYQATRAGAGS